MTHAVQSGEPGGAVIFAVPLVCFGLYTSVIRLVVRQIMLRTAVYTVTDQRLVVNWNGWGGPREVSTYLNHLEPPRVSESDDGVGTIRFGSGNPLDFNTYNRRQRVRWNGDPFTICAIRDVRTVADLIVANRDQRFI
ncbi:MAG TPA: hypothetical protein VH333_24405 [Pseudonocardiaceae bacterium]|jgi:hypothetical protein|nr:hypothetical protein [Pseudonocardiaceae bacterium]